MKRSYEIDMFQDLAKYFHLANGEGTRDRLSVGGEEFEEGVFRVLIGPALRAHVDEVHLTESQIGVNTRCDVVSSALFFAVCTTIMRAGEMRRSWAANVRLPILLTNPAIVMITGLTRHVVTSSALSRLERPCDDLPSR